MPAKLILLRHGQSDWNRKNLFSGWTDVDLTEQGREESRVAARLLRDEGLLFDVAFTSVLKRAIRTLWIVMDSVDRMWVPVYRSWRLNERHYGALQGLDKAKTVAKHGAEQVERWRRGFPTPPPEVTADDPRHPGNDPRYAHLPAADLPGTESLRDTRARVESYWGEAIAPRLRSGNTVMVAAHGHSLRALVMMLDGMGEDEVIGFEIPTAVPLVYELDDGLGSLGRRFLRYPAAVDASAQAEGNQTRG